MPERPIKVEGTLTEEEFEKLLPQMQKQRKTECMRELMEHQVAIEKLLKEWSEQHAPTATETMQAPRRPAHQVKWSEEEIQAARATEPMIPVPESLLTKLRGWKLWWATTSQSPPEFRQVLEELTLYVDDADEPTGS